MSGNIHKHAADSNASFSRIDSTTQNVKSLLQNVDGTVKNVGGVVRNLGLQANTMTSDVSRCKINMDAQTVAIGAQSNRIMSMEVQQNEHHQKVALLQHAHTAVVAGAAHQLKRLEYQFSTGNEA